ncbi:MAG: hypothetical protein JW702_07415 [Clostridiales bacterium]|nr:hypothetical protein [Clostridiales bacterium]
MSNKSDKCLFWTPRILSIIFIAFLLIFSLDVFGQGYSFWETVVGFLIHNIPVFILIGVLIIAWKRELVGTFLFASVGLMYLILVTTRSDEPWYVAMILVAPAWLIAAMFYVGWKAKKRKGE